MLKHETIEKNVGWLIVLTIVAISFGGLVEIVPLFFQKSTTVESELVAKKVWTVADGQAAVVNVASASGMRWTGAAQVAYAATKAGVIQLSRVVAVQYAARGIRVNSVVPGQLHTPMVEARLAGQRTGGDVEALLAQRRQRIPLGFMGDGRDTAAAVLYLASYDARFITGTELVVDGGMTARCD